MRKLSRNFNTNNKYKKRIILFKLARLPFLFNKKNIIQKQPPWKPTYGQNRFFEKFKKLNDEYVLTDWEKVNLIFKI